MPVDIRNKWLLNGGNRSAEFHAMKPILMLEQHMRDWRAALDFTGTMQLINSAQRSR